LKVCGSGAWPLSDVAHISPLGTKNIIHATYQAVHTGNIREVCMLVSLIKHDISDDILCLLKYACTNNMYTIFEVLVSCPDVEVSIYDEELVQHSIIENKFWSIEILLSKTYTNPRSWMRKALKTACLYRRSDMIVKLIGNLDNWTLGELKQAMCILVRRSYSECATSLLYASTMRLDNKALRQLSRFISIPRNEWIINCKSSLP
jgi:hypothetical protein